MRWRRGVRMQLFHFALAGPRHASPLLAVFVCLALDAFAGEPGREADPEAEKTSPYTEEYYRDLEENGKTEGEKARGKVGRLKLVFKEEYDSLADLVALERHAFGSSPREECERLVSRIRRLRRIHDEAERVHNRHPFSREYSDFEYGSLRELYCYCEAYCLYRIAKTRHMDARRHQELIDLALERCEENVWSHMDYRVSLRTRILYGMCHMEAGRYDCALIYFSDVVDIPHPDDERARRIAAGFRITAAHFAVRALLKDGKYREAEDLAERTVSELRGTEAFETYLGSAGAKAKEAKR